MTGLQMQEEILLSPLIDWSIGVFLIKNIKSKFYAINIILWVLFALSPWLSAHTTVQKMNVEPTWSAKKCWSWNIDIKEYYWSVLVGRSL